jgi:tetratricopeptide (TPR) repeat protein
MLDGLAGSPPRAIALALYEQPPPSILSPHDPVLGRYASMLIDARGAAGDDYYIPKIAQITARTLGIAWGNESAELRRAMAIIRRARRNRAGKVRPSAVARAGKRIVRRRARRGVADFRTLHAAGRLRRLLLRADLNDLAVQQFEAMIKDVERSETGPVLPVVMFELMAFADDYAELGELDRAVAMAERARRRGSERGTPADYPEHAAMRTDSILFEHCRAAGLADRCREVAAAMAERVSAHPKPEFARSYARVVNQAEGRAALMRRDYRDAAGFLRQALDDPDPVRLASVPHSIRNDLLFALAVGSDTPLPGTDR